MRSAATRTHRSARLVRLAGRLLRRLGNLLCLDRNPLRRRADVVRTGLTLGLTAVLLASGALSAVVGLHVYDSQRSAVRHTAERLHPATATALQSSGESDGSGGVAHPRVAVRWTDARHRTHVADAQIPGGTTAHQRVRIWLDAHGRPATPPPQDSDLAAGAVGVGAVVWLLSSGLAVGVHAAGRRALLRAQLRAWDEEWARVGPTWTQQWH